MGILELGAEISADMEYLHIFGASGLSEPSRYGMTLTVSGFAKLTLSFYET